MRQTFTLLFFLALFSITANAQRAVLLHSFEDANSFSDFVLAEEKLFLSKSSSFEVYNLSDGHTFHIPKVRTSELFVDRTMGRVGNEIVYNTENGNINLTEGTQSQEILPFHRSYSISTGQNYTLAIVAPIDTVLKIVAIDRVSKEVTTLFERNVWVYGTKLSYLESGDRMFFTIQMEEKRVEIFQTDGSREGTIFMGDVKPIDYSDNTYGYLMNNNEEVFYVSVDQERAGHTPTATQFYKLGESRFTPIEAVTNIGLYEGQTYGRNNVFYGFDRHSRTLVKTQDGSYSNFFEVDNFISFQGEFFSNVVFSANSSSIASGDSLVTLFETNGTSTGTNLIADNVDAFFNNKSVKEYKGYLYFFKYDAVNGRELWRYDGNKAYLVEDIIPGAAGLFKPQFFIYQDKLYFTARHTEETNRIDLYKLSDTASEIKLNSFADYNSNGVKDPDEPYISNMTYNLTTQNHLIYTSDKINNVNLEHGTYTITPVVKEGWLPTSTEQQITVNLPEDNGNSYSFGFTPQQRLTKVNASLMSDATRCGFPTPYTLHYSNSGFTKANGTIKVKQEAKFNFESASPAPTRISGDTLIWQINDLEVGKKGTITLHFTMPGVEHIGDTLISNLFTSFKSPDNHTSYADTTTLQQILTCSYDPNDIQANPAGIGEKHLTLKNQELQYLIRFQNMGTDKAFNIVVQNKLQQEFDLSSFSVIGSSHDMYTVVNGNQVSFHFNNIQLPDDKTDEPGSHGYILYSIKPKSGMPDSTIVENQAFIYFDYNPAIETNVTFNTLVDKLPLKKTVLSVKDDLPKGALIVFPNPASGFVRVAWPSANTTLASYSIMNSKGKQVLQAEFDTQNVHQIDVSALPPGLYLLKAMKQGQIFTKRVILR
ncbi:DUF7619 domain-containing protein [Pontibacter pamirensis]|uniref:DUF7619 domain-containing protein n=1 Tax=Pontibacter pamirensis TaxID=2562824 RepID=UPI00138A3528|nr:T9SS type A sorting domain-containing protein [Pontibacter pamirensis]